MVVDSSVVMAVLRREAEAAAFAAAIEQAEVRLISAANVLELGMVAESRGRAGARELDDFLGRSRFEIVPFDAEQAALARDAFRRFGKGRHRARLDFGDCIAYALSKASGEPLLFKGGDFARTDVDVYAA
jgi:ribonuclease VapC